MYTDYEKRVINSLAEMFPDLAGIVERLVDLHPIVRQHYYHPEMLGSWSLKAVSPTVAPEMDYSALEGISEGMAVSENATEGIFGGSYKGEPIRTACPVGYVCIVRPDPTGAIVIHGA